MSRLKPYAVHLSSAALVALLVVVGAFAFAGRSHSTGTADAAVTSATQPATTELPTTVAPSTTALAVTVPPVTAPPVTVPPVTAPPVTAPPVTAPPVTAPPPPPAPVVESVSGACGGALPSCCIMMRESHGNPLAVNGSSGASGKWQFMPGTWANFGGYSTAASAPESVQDARAAQIWANGAGARNWAGDGC